MKYVGVINMDYIPSYPATNQQDHPASQVHLRVFAKGKGVDLTFRAAAKATSCVALESNNVGSMQVKLRNDERGGQMHEASMRKA